MRNPLIALLLAAALLAGGTLAIASSSSSRYVAVSGYRTAPVAGATSTSYTVRDRYIVSSTWRAAKAKRDATTRRYGPVGSCRIRITIRARSVAAADEPAADRVARLLKTSTRYVYDVGTRQNAAWRVIRDTKAQTITGMLVRPAPTVRSQPAGKRVWLELKAFGRVDPKVECHAGGPRSIAAAFGDLLASGSLGGYQPR